MNPEDQVEETQDAADSPPAEETVEEAPVEDAPVEPVPAVPVAPSVPTIDDQIISGSAGIQAALSKYRASKTAEHDAQMALAAAQTMVDSADGAEGAALLEANDAIDVQIANLQRLRDRLNI